MEDLTVPLKTLSSVYRMVWFVFWVAMLLFIPVGAVFGATAAAIPFFVAFGSGVVALFWRCPSCTRHVGLKRYGIFFLSLPGARRCVHCSAPLVTWRS
jgi:hypothetical protein